MSALTRDTYHHGDLRRALTDAGVELATEGGPNAVVLREATRRVGVSAAAAYRHFADRSALLDAVVARAQSRAADVIAEAIASAVPDAAQPGEDERRALAHARFRAVGLGYLRFAMTEPGMFRTAFGVPVDLTLSTAAEAAGADGRTAFQLLSDTLDELAEVGALSQEARPGAELLAWSSVHGLAMLALEGPLRELPAEDVLALAPALVAMVDRGLGLTS